MPRLTPLPEKIRYLQPFRKQVAKLKPEEIDESMDLSLLDKLLLERIRELPTDDGKKLLQEDHAILEEWLSSPGLQDNGGMVFLHGYLMALPDLVDRLLEERDKPQERIEIQMELPPEAKVKKLPDGTWKVSWLRATLFVGPINKDYMELEAKSFYETRADRLIKFKVTPVSFGNVTGLKRLTDASIVEGMKAEYVLEVPGGYVSVSLLKHGNRIDEAKFKEFESKFEQYFHTIRVLRV
jgi:hypothetical protein